jgi:hypothetical protein
MQANPQIIGFLTGNTKDSEGRLLRQILAWPDDHLEAVHDFIQWLFPLTEPSPVNPEAPVLDAATISEIRGRPELQDAVGASADRMRRFYAGSRHWITPGNHNHLRITRMLKCLKLCGLDREAADFFGWLSGIYQDEQQKPNPGITRRSFEFWRNAAGGAIKPM